MVLTSFARVNTVAAEFLPKVMRACTDLSWNASHTSWIAAGYEVGELAFICLAFGVTKYLQRDRRDAGVYLWDVERGEKAVSSQQSAVISR
jgi:hypothetical protein